MSVSYREDDILLKNNFPNGLKVQCLPIFNYFLNKWSIWGWLERGRASQVTLVLKNLSDSAGNTRDAGLISGSERSPGEGNGSPLQYACLSNSVDKGARWATVHGVAEELDRAKQLSMHAHVCIYVYYVEIYMFYIKYAHYTYMYIVYLHVYIYIVYITIYVSLSIYIYKIYKK